MVRKRKGFSTGTKVALVAITVFALGAAVLNFTTLGGTLANLTLNTQPALEQGLLLHWTLDGKDMDYASTTAEVRDRSGNARNGNLSGQ